MNYQIDVFKIHTLENFINDLLKDYKVAFLNLKRGNIKDEVCIFKEHILKDFINAILDVLIIMNIDYKIENDVLSINNDKSYLLTDKMKEDLLFYVEKVNNEYKNLILKYKEFMSTQRECEDDIRIDTYLQTILYKFLGMYFSLSSINIKLLASGDSFAISSFDENEYYDIQHRLKNLIKQRDESIIERIKLSKKIENINDELLLEQKRIKLAKLNKTIYDDNSYQNILKKINEYNESIKTDYNMVHERYDLEIKNNVHILNDVIETVGVELDKIENFDNNQKIIS